jgi:hypothetical protein
MTPTPAIPLDRACLCLNCNNVVESSTDACPACSMRGLMALSPLLDSPLPECEGCGTNHADGWAEVYRASVWRDGGWVSRAIFQIWRPGSSRSKQLPTRLFCASCAGRLDSFLAFPQPSPSITAAPAPRFPRDARRAAEIGGANVTQ